MNWDQNGGKDSGSEPSADATLRMMRPQEAAVDNRGYADLQDAASPSGRLSDRIGRLRQRCTEALGRDAFRDAYMFLKQHEEVSPFHLLHVHFIFISSQRRASAFI